PGARNRGAFDWRRVHPRPADPSAGDCEPLKSDCLRSLAADVARRLVVPDARKLRVPEVAVASPLDERDLDDVARLEPSQLGHLFFGNRFAPVAAGAVR